MTMHPDHEQVSAEKDKTSEDSVNEEQDPALPVDRGWAWIIIFASSMMFCIMAGTYKCYGIIKLELQYAYPEVGQDIITWVLSLNSCVTLVSGPLVSYLLTKTSHRVIGMTGGLVSSLGLVLTAYSPNAYFLFFSFSFLFAIGVGFISMVCFTSFLPYFKKRRALAVGIMASGSGVGGTVCPMLVSYLYDTYSHTGALLCYGGFYMQIVVLSSLLRPISYYEQTTNRRKSIANTTSTIATVSSDHEENFNTDSSLKSSLYNSNSPSEPLRPISHSSISLPADKYDLDPPKYTSVPGALNRAEHDDFVEVTELTNKSIIYQSKLMASQLSMGIPLGSAYDISDSEATSQSVVSQEETNPETKYNWKIWCDHRTWIVGTTMFLATTGLNFTFITGPSFAKEYHVNEELVSNIITYSGLGEIVFRLLHGWFADSRVMPIMIQLMIVVMVMGSSALVATIIPGLIGTIILYAALATCGSSLFSLMPIVVLELFGPNDMSTIVGINGVYQAASFIFGTFATNSLYSRYQTWKSVYYFIGASFLIAAVLLVIYYTVKSFRDRFKQRTVKESLNTPLTA